MSAGWVYGGQRERERGAQNELYARERGRFEEARVARNGLTQIPYVTLCHPCHPGPDVLVLAAAKGHDLVYYPDEGRDIRAIWSWSCSSVTEVLRKEGPTLHLGSMGELVLKTQEWESRSHLCHLPCGNMGEGKIPFSLCPLILAAGGGPDSSQLQRSPGQYSRADPVDRGAGEPALRA